MERLRALLRPFRPLARNLRSTRRTAAAAHDLVDDLVDDILVLPTISRHLEIVALQTATLVEIHEELVQVRSNTAALPHLDIELARVHETLCHVELNTQAVQRLADLAEPLHGAAMRVGRLAGRLPQRHATAPTRSNDGRPHPSP